MAVAVLAVHAHVQVVDQQAVVVWDQQAAVVEVEHQAVVVVEVVVAEDEPLVADYHEASNGANVPA